jgi:hypothetical protein
MSTTQDASLRMPACVAAKSLLARALPYIWCVLWTSVFSFNIVRNLLDTYTLGIYACE